MIPRWRGLDNDLVHRSDEMLVVGPPTWDVDVGRRTLLDGLVLARSVFNHSINYRSVVVLGSARIVENDEKRDALHAFTEHVAPGRWAEARQPTEQELKATWILSLPLTEASAKVRTGPPEDDPEDLDFPIWSGVVPFTSRLSRRRTGGAACTKDGSSPRRARLRSPRSERLRPRRLSG